MGTYLDLQEVDGVMVSSPDKYTLYYITSARFLGHNKIYAIAVHKLGLLLHELKAKLRWTHNIFSAIMVPSPMSSGACTKSSPGIDQKPSIDSQASSFHQ